ncbi:MAG: alpha/beta fold hydrolase [Bacillota bacterium]
MPNLAINDISLFYDVKGDGDDTVAFLNGVAMSTERWAAQTPFFSENYRVLLHDFRGQGKSTLVSEGITFETHVRDMAALLDALGIDRLHIVGVSYGAEVGMYFALMYPERVKSLILGTAVSESDPLLKAMIESWIEAAETCNGRLFFKVMAPTVYSKSFYATHKKWLDDYAELFGKRVTVEWMDAFAELCRNFLTLDVTDRLSEIRLPTLVISAAEDILKPPGYGQIIHQRIPGSRFVVAQGAGHALFFEKADEFNHLVLDFIQSHGMQSGE